MDCTQTTWLTNDDYLLQFNHKVVQQRIPIFGSFELNHRCNLRCVHCYLGSQDTIHNLRHFELSTKQALSIIDQITAAGCLYLLITGGDPLLRRDFAEIYRHAKMNGLLVTIFTNGTLITDKILDLFDDLPPQTVEISLYGATTATYEKVTGIKGSYHKCISGIQRLLEHNIKVKLKTVVMTHNQHEFLAMKKMAQDFDVRFRYDSDIFPAFDGDKSPIALRVSPEEVMNLEFADKERYQEWRDFARLHPVQQQSDYLYQCGAGLSSFHIDPYGNVQPCLMTVGYKYSLLENNFETIWQELIPGIRQKKISNAAPCKQCDKRNLCGFCPAFFDLENGVEDARSQYLCDVGHLRYDKLYGSSNHNRANGQSVGCGCDSSGCGSGVSTSTIHFQEQDSYPIQIAW